MKQRRTDRITKVVKKRLPGIIVILEDIHDPHNAAAILRTCDAFGIQNVWFIFDKETPYNPRRIGKASSSSANKWLDFRVFSSTHECILALKQDGYTVYTTALSDRALSLDTCVFPQKNIAVIVGNEKNGVSETARTEADALLAIPMLGFVQSLNVSVAAAVVLWEITRQRIHAGSPLTLGKKEHHALLEDLLERAKTSSNTKTIQEK